MLIRCSPPSVQRSMRKTLLSHGYVLSVSPQKKKSWLQPKARICAKGVLELSIYLDKINLSCRVEEMAEWVKPVMTNGTEDELPF